MGDILTRGMKRTDGSATLRRVFYWTRLPRPVPDERSPGATGCTLAAHFGRKELRVEEAGQEGGGFTATPSGGAGGGVRFHDESPIGRQSVFIKHLCFCIAFCWCSF